MHQGTRLGVVAVLLSAVINADSAWAEAVSFQDDLMPHIKRRCGACHITGDEPGKMALVPGKAWSSWVNQPSVEGPALLRIAPGEPEQSYVIHKLRGSHIEVGGVGVRMPMHQPPLPSKLIAQFEAWIEQGALDN